MGTEYERIQQVRKHYALTQTKFGERMGISRDMVNNLEHGRAEIKDYVRKLICTSYRVNENWLRTGEGDMIEPAATDDEEFDQLLADIEFSGDDFIKRLLYSYWKLDENEKAVIKKLIDGLCGK